LADARRVIAVQRANELAARRYVPGRYDGRLTYFQGDAATDAGNDVIAGWARWSSQPVEVVSVSGDHVTMVARPHVEIVASRLRACLDQALRSMPAGEAKRGVSTHRHGDATADCVTAPQ
jgi:thioesterase domain-containing protein